LLIAAADFASNTSIKEMAIPIIFDLSEVRLEGIAMNPLKNLQNRLLLL